MQINEHNLAPTKFAIGAIKVACMIVLCNAYNATIICSLFSLLLNLLRFQHVLRHEIGPPVLDAAAGCIGSFGDQFMVINACQRDEFI